MGCKNSKLNVENEIKQNKIEEEDNGSAVDESLNISKNKTINNINDKNNNVGKKQVENSDNKTFSALMLNKTNNNLTKDENDDVNKQYKNDNNNYQKEENEIPTKNQNQLHHNEEEEEEGEEKGTHIIPKNKDIKTGTLNKENLLKRITTEEENKINDFLILWEKEKLKQYEINNNHNNLLEPDYASIVRTIRHVNYNTEKAIQLYTSFALWHLKNTTNSNTNSSNSLLSKETNVHTGGKGAADDEDNMNKNGEEEEGLSDEKRAVLEASYFQYFAPGLFIETHLFLCGLYVI